ncbi:MAG: hypothetical protein LC126_01965 [Bryobacterales bacterium]|nr:hypothetical protein [Bryobacterales bacterium]
MPRARPLWVRVGKPGGSPKPWRRDDLLVPRTGLTAGPNGALLSSLETDAVSGIFLLDAAGVETRRFHTPGFRIRHAAIHPDGAVRVFPP